jgi:hypothetical protein
VEIPYPFNILQKEKSQNLILDYRIETLAENDCELLYMLKSITKKRESKFYNTQIEIVIT